MRYPRTTRSGEDNTRPMGRSARQISKWDTAAPRAQAPRGTSPFPDVRSAGYPVKAGVTELPAVVVWAPVLPTTVVVVVGVAVVVVVVVGSSPMAAR